MCVFVCLYVLCMCLSHALFIVNADLSVLPIKFYIILQVNPSKLMVNV